jgi:hypothetical protein
MNRTMLMDIEWTDLVSVDQGYFVRLIFLRACSGSLQDGFDSELNKSLAKSERYGRRAFSRRNSAPLAIIANCVEVL